MGYENIELQRDDRIGRLVLNRPERRNALSLAVMREALDALDSLAADTAVHVIVVEGRGPAFSAGHDLGELTAAPPVDCDNVFSTCVRLMSRLHEVPQPVVARVQGVATAAGCQLVAACDLAIASTEARFATPGVNIGLFCSTPMVPVERAVGRKRALEMLFTGEMIDAATALEWGLVNRVVAPDELDAAVDELASRIAQASPAVLALGKRAFYEQAGLTEGDAYDVVTPVMAENARNADAHEGMTAFLEKRTPQWPNR
jgi:enoyl-CoA hydratase/carnithine racemase